MAEFHVYFSGAVAEVAVAAVALAAIAVSKVLRPVGVWWYRWQQMWW